MRTDSHLWYGGRVFHYAEDITSRFPDLRTAVVQVTGVDNTRRTDGLDEEYRRQQQVTGELLQTIPIAELPSVAAWRSVFTGLGVKPTKYRAAVEALLRRLHKSGDIPHITPLVDIGNLVSIRHHVPVAVFDVARFGAPITVRLATGTERFADLGADTVVSPEPGEVVFVDQADEVCARRWCWRQSSRSATDHATTDALFVIEAHHAEAEADVAAAARDLEKILTEQQPGITITAQHLSADGGPVRFDPEETS